MLNRQIHLTDHQQKPYNYNQYDFYEQIYKLNDSRKFILNHLIFPNFELLKQDQEYKEIYVNDFRKHYYQNHLIDFKTEYQAFYPENYYYFWDVLNNFKIITKQSKIFIFHDADNNKIPLGHLEAVFRFCEDNFRYEDNEYYHIVTEKKHQDKNKKFMTINKNYKTYIINNNKIIKDFDCFINMSKDINTNFIMSGKIGNNTIIYLNDFFDCKEDEHLDKLINCYEKAYIYQPSLQDNLVTSVYLILLNFQGQKNKNNQTTLSIIRNNYYITYLEKITKLQNLLANEENVLISQSDLLEKWVIKNNLITTPTEYSNDLSYFKSNLNCQKDIKMINIKNFYHEKLHSNKRNLNKYKRVIDTKEQFVDNDLDHEIVDWNKLTDCIDLYKNLKKMIIWKHNAEAVNNVWLKFYELLVQENVIDNNVKKIKTFHIYETSGSSIFAFNHFIATHTNVEIFEWYARCPDYYDFKGRYNLLDIYPNNWIKSNQIDILKQDSRLKDIDIIICDPGMKITPDKFNEQESYMLLLILEQLYTSLQLLPLNKILITKIYLPLAESLSIQILYLLSLCFETVKVVKPLSSHASSSEIFCICYNYNGNIQDAINKNIKSILTKKDITLNIFETIPENFIEQIVHISDVLVVKQINSIKRSLYLRHYYYYDYDLQNSLSDTKEEKCIQWMEINKMKSISNKFKLITS